MEIVREKRKLSTEELKKISGKLAEAMIICIAAALMLMQLWPLAVDSDTNFILYEGKRIAEGGIQYWNMASAAGRMKTVVQQWLYDLIVYRIYSAAGWRGLYLANAVQAVILGALLIRLCRVLKGSRDVSLMTSLIALAEFIGVYGTTRPEMITGILLVANAVLMERYAGSRKIRYLLMCMPLVTLEANLHASMWVMHAVLMLPYAIPYDMIFDVFHLRKSGDASHSYRKLPVLAAVLATPVFALANPYGADGLMYLFNAAGMNLREKAGIIEMQYPTLVSFRSVPYLILLVLLGRYAKKAEPEHIILFVGGFCTFALAERNIILLCLSAVPLSVSVLTGLAGDCRSAMRKGKPEQLPAAEKRKPLQNCRIFQNAKIAGAVIMIASCVLVSAIAVSYPPEEGDNSSFPAKAEKYIRKEKKKAGSSAPARVMTEYGSGAYFERMGEKIYIDARPELWRKKINGKADIYDEYISLNRITEKQYEKLKRKYNFDYIFAKKGSFMEIRCQNDPKAKKAVSGNGYVLYKLEK